MFKISPINDKKYQAECAEQCGTTFKPDYFAYSMTDIDTGILMGFSQFEITQNGGYIADLKERVGYSDFEAMFILGRAVLNFIDLMSEVKGEISVIDEDIPLRCSVVIIFNNILTFTV